jgi:hypothetical protein
VASGQPTKTHAVRIPQVATWMRFQINYNCLCDMADSFVPSDKRVLSVPLIALLLMLVVKSKPTVQRARKRQKVLGEFLKLLDEIHMSEEDKAELRETFHNIAKHWKNKRTRDAEALELGFIKEKTSEEQNAVTEVQTAKNPLTQGRKSKCCATNPSDVQPLRDDEKRNREVLLRRGRALISDRGYKSKSANKDGSDRQTLLEEEEREPKQTGMRSVLTGLVDTVRAKTGMGNKQAFGYQPVGDDSHV